METNELGRMVSSVELNLGLHDVVVPECLETYV